MAADSFVAPYLQTYRPAPGEPRWLVEGRAAALARFSELGLPTRREEAWRFTDLRPLQRIAYPPAAAGGRVGDPHLTPWRLAGAAWRVVLVDGVFAPRLSALDGLPKGAWLASTAATLAKRPELLEEALAPDANARQPFAALNAALFADGWVLALEPGVVLDRPVEVIHLARGADPRSIHPRSAALLGAGSSARLVETFAGVGDYWTNVATAVRVGPGANLAHIRVQDESENAIHLALTQVRLDAAARYYGFALTLGARLSRLDLQVRFDGPGAHCGLDGAFLLRGEQEATTATFIDHASPEGTTRELFKGVVEDRAHGVFLGRIAVREQAQKTDAQQTNRNLLLSRRAAIDTKPELEILADDVKCAHGATVGDLDEEQMFYLRSRGLAEEDARRLLVEAFAAETLDRVEDTDLREPLSRHLRRWLEGTGSDA
jgi:Fe-S cluster assembly protein SufD